MWFHMEAAKGCYHPSPRQLLPIEKAEVKQKP